MTDAMKHWVTKYDIDGFRCDVAFMVPVDFWNENRKALEKIKPMYMLAEMEANNDINKTPAQYYTTAFNASYAWTFMGASADLSAEKKSVNEFKSIMQKNYAELPSSMHKMFFLTNHDENSWNATIQERYGENWKAIAAMVYTLPQSLPLIYTGEEVGLSRRLKFFERDPIKHAEWMDTTRFSFYRDLIRLHHTNPALKNFQQGAIFQELDVNVVNESNSIYAYKRSYKDSEVYVLLNFSNEKLEFNFKSGRKNFESYNIYSNMIFDNFKGEENYMIAPNSFVIFYK
jgi:glycosidase